MVAWSDYKSQAKDRGSLALELYVANSTPATTPQALKENLAAHLAYQRELEAAGSLVLAGPLSDTAGENMQGVGMMIYRAASMAEAQEIVAADPMHISGARTYTLHKWLVNEGSISLNVGLSTGKVSME